VPMAVSRGSGAELNRGLGLTVIGGLTLSTFFTLFLVPVLYHLFESGRERRNQRRLEEERRG
jgi:multidrug efflux pump subunit AcrB